MVDFSSDQFDFFWYLILELLPIKEKLHFRYLNHNFDKFTIISTWRKIEEDVYKLFYFLPLMKRHTKLITEIHRPSISPTLNSTLIYMSKQCRNLTFLDGINLERGWGKKISTIWPNLKYLKLKTDYVSLRDNFDSLLALGNLRTLHIDSTIVDINVEPLDFSFITKMEKTKIKHLIFHADCLTSEILAVLPANLVTLKLRTKVALPFTVSCLDRPMPNLKRLDLKLEPNPNVFHDTSERWEFYLTPENFPILESLLLHTFICGVTNSLFGQELPLPCPIFSNLKLVNLPKFHHPTSLIQLTTFAPNLTSINFCNNNKVNNMVVSTLLSQLLHLRYFDISQCAINDQAFTLPQGRANISEYPLRYLKVREVNRLGARFLDFVLQFANQLRLLDVNLCLFDEEVDPAAYRTTSTANFFLKSIIQRTQGRPINWIGLDCANCSAFQRSIFDLVMTDKFPKLQYLIVHSVILSDDLRENENSTAGSLSTYHVSNILSQLNDLNLVSETHSRFNNWEKLPNFFTQHDIDFEI